jgi:hypothetical protein
MKASEPRALSQWRKQLDKLLRREADLRFETRDLRRIPFPCSDLKSQVSGLLHAARLPADGGPLRVPETDNDLLAMLMAKTMSKAR